VGQATKNHLIRATAALALAAGLWAASPASAAVGTIMFVVVNSASLDAQETAKKTLMEGWGYTVVPISATASAGTFNTAALTSSCAYISETVTSTDLNTKLKNTTMGVVSEEPALVDDFEFSSNYTMFNGTAINVTNTTHYITSQFPAGTLTICSSSQPLFYPSGTLGSFTTLCKQPASSSVVLSVMERGDDLYGSGTGSAAGRRVFLPWAGSTSFDFNALNASGQMIMKRSIEWCLLPIAYWKLDDASGTTAVDTYGGYNGTLNGPTWTTGRKAGGLALDGLTDYVSIADASAFHVTSALTVAGWIKQTAAFPTGSTVCIILRKGDANPNNWELCIANGHAELNLDCGDADGAGTDGTTTLTTNKWYHVAGTWDGANARVYLNGVLDCTPKAKAAPIGTDSRAVYLGGRIGSTDVTTGTVDEVRFYNRCLTAAEIAALAKANPTITSWQMVNPNP
jgi:hypothetical protein